jgi:hypothetical protein
MIMFHFVRPIPTQCIDINVQYSRHTSEVEKTWRETPLEDGYRRRCGVLNANPDPRVLQHVISCNASECRCNASDKFLTCKLGLASHSHPPLTQAKRQASTRQVSLKHTCDSKFNFSLSTCLM